MFTVMELIRWDTGLWDVATLIDRCAKTGSKDCKKNVVIFKKNTHTP